MFDLLSCLLFLWLLSLCFLSISPSHLPAICQVPKGPCHQTSQMRAQEPTASTFSSLTFSTLCTHFLVENQWKRTSNHFLIMKPKGFLLSSQTPLCSHGHQSGVGRVSCSSAIPSVSQVLNTGSFWGFSFLPLYLLSFR